MNEKLISYGKIFRLCGLHWCARAIQPGANVRVTYTHGVRRADMEKFGRIVQYLRQIRAIISPETFFSLYADGRRPLNGRSLLITFDDGLLSSYRATREVLDCHGIKAIFFVPTAILNLKTEDEMRRFAAENIYYGSRAAGSLTPDEFEFMTADHLVELTSDGHMICPHTHNHVFLQDIRDEATVQLELIQPRKILEDLLHSRVRAFAFPIGTEKQVGTLAYDRIRQHYDFCFTALPGVNSWKTAPHRLHRDCLAAEAPLSYVRMVMMGTYDLYYKIRMHRLKKRIA